MSPSFMLRWLLATLLLAVLTACSPTSVAPVPTSTERPTSLPAATATTQPATPVVTGGIDLSSLTGRIVFDNHEDVWSINADGTDLTRLTDSPWPEFDATWSPDGTQIAFRSDSGPNADSEIWLMNADGSDHHRLTRGLSPAWFPDGSKIAYASPGEILCPPGRGLRCTGISIMNADGSGQHRLQDTDGGEYPSWSPDGKRIIFNSNLVGQHLMSIVDVDGSRVVDLSSVGEGWQVDWSPDGRSILFASGRDQNEPGYDDIYVMRPDGSGVKRLTDMRAYTPAWSPDGSYIVFSAPGLFVMRADGSGITPLPMEGVGETSLPDWKP